MFPLIIIDHSQILSSFQIPDGMETVNEASRIMDWGQFGFPDQVASQLPNTSHSPTNYSTEGGLTFPWYGQGSTDVEWLDAAGGIVLQGASRFMNATSTNEMEGTRPEFQFDGFTTSH
jgi:hypothetical protein